MKRKQIIIGAVFSVFLVVCTPVLANVLHKENYAPGSDIIREDKVDQKELLFQTIIDIVNNREIQRVLFNSEMRRGTEKLFSSGMKFSVFTPYVLTKKYLNIAYSIGLILSKTLSKSKIDSMLERYQLNNQGLQKEITAVIEKNDGLSRKMEQLSEFHCNFCGNKSGVTYWPFPVICSVLGVVVLFFLFLTLTIGVGDKILETTFILGQKLNCWP